MHQPFRRLFPLLVLLVLFPGCTIEKRLYTKGWSIERGHVHRTSVREEQRSTEAAAMPVTADLPVEKILPPSPETLSQPETADLVLSVAEAKVDSPVPAVGEVRVTASENTAQAEDPKAGLKEASDDEKANDRRRLGIAVGAILAVLAGVVLVLTIGGLLTSVGSGMEMAFLGMILLCLGAGILAAILISVNSRKLKKYDTDHPENTRPEKEKTPEEAALLKRKGAIVMGVFVAAIVAVIIALNRS